MAQSHELDGRMAWKTRKLAGTWWGYLIIVLLCTSFLLIGMSNASIVYFYTVRGFFSMGMLVVRGSGPLPRKT
jgi:hypothetical protein